MRKKHETTDPRSCLNRAGDEEMLFTLRGKDATAPATIRFWVSERIRTGKNQPGDQQTTEALECAETMETDRVFCAKNKRRIELAEKKSRGTVTPDELVEFDRLQAEIFEYLNTLYPRPPSIAGQLDEIEKRLGDKT